MKTRRVLQDLQASATDNFVLVGSPKVAPKSMEVVEKIKISIAADKENPVKKPRRKNAKGDLKTSTKPPSKKVKQSKQEQIKTNSDKESVIPNIKLQYCLSSSLCSSTTSPESISSSSALSPNSDSTEQKVLVTEDFLNNKQQNVEDEDKFTAPLPVVKETVRKAKRRKANDETSLKKKSKLPPVKQSKLEQKDMPVTNSDSIYNQSGSVSSVPSTSSLSIASKESVPSDLGNVTVHSSFPEDMSVIQSDSPSLPYWQELAEQRRITLEKALLENEQLCDQIQVLETEKSLLKEALECAERLCRMEGLLD